MKLIKLTQFDNDNYEYVEEVYINADTIISIRPRDWYSEVEIRDFGQLKVEETVEEVKYQLLYNHQNIAYSLKREIGKKIKEIRQTCGMSVGEFGEQFGLSGIFVMTWETGRNLPNEEILKQIVDLGDFTGSTIRELLEG